ncbi:3-oxoacyl-ACP reductase family protein [Metabacillus niabensis]|uniref:3-oxoacyl-[acyl-carrier protein] reductase n=1 Tax=Metabacillus niabensis TaxID=324854 RepID=A0ABT9Z324_9BACI|nr:3-oxoacyl-ACP reductase family protein [Metabacillus niabensis]MDQ0226410.1 3-oxoacyl-[acyl-carrier protein] reductase [Metabacillus niabensis]
MKNEKKVAIVTGASRGIGQAIAIALANKGFSVVINYHNSHAGAEETLAKIKQNGGEAILHQGSVANAEDMKQMVENAIEHFGTVDVLVNNAGILIPKYLMMTKPDEWNQTIETNLTGAYLGIKAVLRPMIEKKRGRIINISSVASISGIAGQAAYAASKSGLNGITKVLAKELAPYNILVNSIAPGFIETDMTGDFPERMLEEYRDSIPLKRFGRPEEIANFVTFLSSDEAEYVTGQIFAIDGGLSV